MLRRSDRRKNNRYKRNMLMQKGNKGEGGGQHICVTYCTDNKSVHWEFHVFLNEFFDFNVTLNIDRHAYKDVYMFIK